MAIGTRPRGRGFWSGLVVGFVLAGLVAVALAYIFPPTRYLAPEIAPDAVMPPAAPEAPRPGSGPAAPRAGGLLAPAAPAPLITERPAAEMPPGLPGLAPPRAPDVFDGGASGSPSLVP